jgi:glutamine amidotransferase
MIAVIDYGRGNVRSLSNAVEYIGYDALITSDAKKIGDADKIILPGVGAFGDAMRAIRERALDTALYREVIEKGKPMLGICLGLQLLGKSSEEHGYHEGLGWIDAQVRRFDPGLRLKVPHVGWNDIDYSNPAPLFKGLKRDERSFYFVHSFYLDCNEPTDILATCEYGKKFTAAIRHNNILATQFHPEKSQDNGIQVLTNFLRWNP